MSEMAVGRDSLRSGRSGSCGTSSTIDPWKNCRYDHGWKNGAVCHHSFILWNAGTHRNYRIDKRKSADVIWTEDHPCAQKQSDGEVCKSYYREY